MIEYIMVLFLVLFMIGLVFGVVYPLIIVACYKLSGSKKSIKEILDEN